MSLRSLRTLIPLLTALHCTAPQAAAELGAVLEILPTLPNEFGVVRKTEISASPIAFSGIAGGHLDNEGAGSVSARFGTLKTFGSMQGRGTVSSEVSYKDTLTFNAPGLAIGQEMQVTFEMVVSGSLDIGPVGRSSRVDWELFANLNGGSRDLQLGGRLADIGSGPIYGGSEFGTHRATVTLLNGKSSPLVVGMRGLATYSEGGGRNGWATYNLGNSAYWGGITSVRASGVEVASYTLTSESGTDYRFSMTPVPEPGGAMLLTCGLILLGLRRLQS